MGHSLEPLHEKIPCQFNSAAFDGLTVRNQFTPSIPDIAHGILNRIQPQGKLNLERGLRVGTQEGSKRTAH